MAELYWLNIEKEIWLNVIVTDWNNWYYVISRAIWYTARDTILQYECNNPIIQPQYGIPIPLVGLPEHTVSVVYVLFFCIYYFYILTL